MVIYFAKPEEELSLKKKAISSSDSTVWGQYKRATKQANNAIKLAKKLYVSENLEINKGNLVKTC